MIIVTILPTFVVEDSVVVGGDFLVSEDQEAITGELCIILAVKVCAVFCNYFTGIQAEN